MNILEQAKNEEFVKEQFIKGRILDDTKDYGRTQFVDEIYKLQQENKQLKDNWNKLKERIEYLERSNNRREDTILEQRQKISDLEDNWNKLKEIMEEETREYWDTDILEIMQELEQGSDK